MAADETDRRPHSDGPSQGRPETLRVHLANERTLLAWVRTGIALMALGFAIARFGLFLRQVAAAGNIHVPPAHSLGSTEFGAVLVALGALANLAATVRYARVRQAVERGEVGPPGSILVLVIGTTATLVGMGMAILLARALFD
jgi:putative membrane protein